MQRIKNSNAPQPAAEGGLFALQKTRESARQAAECSAPSRCAQILRLLQDQPLTCFEIAQRLNVTDNQISGRFKDLRDSKQIIATGMTRKNPRTGQVAVVYAIAQDQAPRDLSADMGYPDYLQVGDGRFQRDGGSEQDLDVPGVNYSRRIEPDATQGHRQAIRVALISCQHCGSPLKKIGTVEVNGRPTSQFKCGGRDPKCRIIWTIQIAQVPGGPQIPLLVATTF